MFFYEVIESIIKISREIWIYGKNSCNADKVAKKKKKTNMGVLIKMTH